jgi:hypothetical protein
MLGGSATTVATLAQKETHATQSAEGTERYFLLSVGALAPWLPSPDGWG